MTSEESKAISIADKAIKNRVQVPPLANFTNCLRLANSPYCIFSPVDDSLRLDVVITAVAWAIRDGSADILLLDHFVSFKGSTSRLTYDKYTNAKPIESAISWLKDPFDFLIYFPMKTDVAEKVLTRAHEIQWRCCSKSYLHRRVAYPATLYALLAFQCRRIDLSSFGSMSISSGSDKTLENSLNSLLVDFQCSLSIALVLIKGILIHISSYKAMHLLRLLPLTCYHWIRFSLSRILDGFCA